MRLFASAAFKQTLLLAGLLLVRFGYEIVGFAGYLALTYILAWLFFSTIPKEERPLYHITWPKKKTVIIVCLVGILFVAIHAIVRCLFMEARFISPPSPWMWVTIIPIGTAFMTVGKFFINALPEELLFRGFLWQYLRRYKISNFSILFIQALLFWAGHYYYYALPPGYWLSTFFAGLVFGIVAWKTKSLFMSSIVHAMANSIRLTNIPIL